MLCQFQMSFGTEQDVIRIVCGNCKRMGWKLSSFLRSYIALNVTSHESSIQNKLQGLEPCTPEYNSEILSLETSSVSVLLLFLFHNCGWSQV
jgi:hypothetical protein